MKKDVLDFAGAHPGNAYWPEGAQALAEKLVAAVPDDAVPEVSHSSNALECSHDVVFEVSLLYSKDAHLNFLMMALASVTAFYQSQNAAASIIVYSEPPLMDT